jgi:hypothetical protein
MSVGYQPPLIQGKWQSGKVANGQWPVAKWQSGKVASGRWQSGKVASGRVAKWQSGEWQVAEWQSGQWQVAKWHSGSAVDLRQQPETECHEQLKVNVLVPRPAANGAPLVVAGRWHKCGTRVAQVWHKYGTGVAQVWHRCGTKCGTGVASTSVTSGEIESIKCETH